MLYLIPVALLSLCYGFVPLSSPPCTSSFHPCTSPSYLCTLSLYYVILLLYSVLSPCISRSCSASANYPTLFTRIRCIALVPCSRCLLTYHPPTAAICIHIWLLPLTNPSAMLHDPFLHATPYYGTSLPVTFTPSWIFLSSLRTLLMSSYLVSLHERMH